MTTDNIGAPPAEAMPVLQRTYLKSLAVELPIAPHGFLDRTAPHLDCNITKRHHGLAPQLYEVVVCAFVSVTLGGGRVLLLVRAEQAGIFDLSDCAASEHGRLLNVTCRRYCCLIRVRK